MEEYITLSVRGADLSINFNAFFFGAASGSYDDVHDNTKKNHKTA